ncbi:MFS transporter [Dasania sp. GY-MA-18]|uniref:MFS transporter n=1 Tax=Dasania phycosphaerae TaxID=2950436 RepID=A0A9J6RMV5_9GAMM|nr:MULTISPECIES: MFS transporter [Dasania]MCR8923217.1 MFS transporter [Dasania sp. GY-MA-18]MCZ0865649.1 MFS transporter [Dasania phycosphaerae]MCZ0869374.1 MFS transporter [Dasania phycosphaerae]
MKKFIESYLSKEVLGPFAAMYGVGFAPLLILPFLFSAIVKHFSISESEAGLLITVELAAMCLGSLVLAPVIDKFSKRLLAIWAVVIVAIGNLAVVFTDSLSAGYVCLAVAGFGYGVALAAGNASVAAMKGNADEVFNKVVFLGTVLMVLLLNIFPRLIVAWSLPGALLGLVALHLLMLPAIARLSPAKSEAKHDHSNKGQFKVLLQPLALVIIVMMFCYFVRDTMLWVFAESIGSNRLGMAVTDIGFLFSIHGAMSLLGPLLMLWLMHKFGKALLLIAGIIVSGAISIVVSQTHSVFVYSFLVIIWSTAHFFTYSCIMCFAAAADEKGRVAAAAGAAVMGGTAVAPAIAGYAMDSGGLPQFTLAVIIAVLLTIAFTIATTLLFPKNIQA